jgi:hypothetical protein
VHAEIVSDMVNLTLKNLSEKTINGYTLAFNGGNMLKSQTQKLCLKFFTLALLITCLVVFSSSNSVEQVQAYGCCESCDPAYYEELQTCYVAYSAGAAQDACANEARTRMLNCLHHCEMCEGGGSGIFLGAGSNPAPPGYSYCFRTYECTEYYDGNGDLTARICHDLYETCYP